MCGFLILSLYLQWRPGLLPRLTAYGAVVRGSEVLPAMEAGTIAPADLPSKIFAVPLNPPCNGGRDYCPG